MTQDLGKIERPEADSFKQARKLLLVPLLYAGEGTPKEYMEKFDLYWKEVAEHISRLESRIGEIKHIYHESIAIAGDDGLKVMERLNARSYEIAKEKLKHGAQLEAIEDRDLADENMDWERFIMVGCISEKVARKIAELYAETSKKRYEYMGKKIQETLQADEAAILFIREGHLLQFPQDIEVFSVSPPALDDIHRWFRDRNMQKESKDDA